MSHTPYDVDRADDLSVGAGIRCVMSLTHAEWLKLQQEDEWVANNVTHPSKATQGGAA